MVLFIGNTLYMASPFWVTFSFLFYLWIENSWWLLPQNILYIFEIFLAWHSYCSSSSIHFRLPCLLELNNRSESLSGYLPKLELKYLKIKLLLVASVAEYHVKKKRRIRLIYLNAPILLQDKTLICMYLFGWQNLEVLIGLMM